MQTMDKIEKAQEEKQAISTTKMCNTHWITDELIIQTSTIFTLDNSKKFQYHRDLPFGQNRSHRVQAILYVCFNLN